MKLQKEETDLFYKLSWGLLYYANKKFNIISNLTSPDFKGKNMQDVARLDEKLFDNPIIFEEFIRENPLNFNFDELKIIKEWKNSIRGEFFIFIEKDKAIFLTSEKEPKAYNVYGIIDDIIEILPFEPYMAKVTLLPFKGKIVYSGIFHGYSINLGGGMKKVVYRDFIKAKSKFGIIESLDLPLQEKQQNNEELLKFYLKNEENRFEYEREIENILKKEPFLIKTYYQELSRINSRKLRKKLAKLNINSGYFAVFNDIIIASAETEAELKGKLKYLLGERAEYAYIFKYGGKMDENNFDEKLMTEENKKRYIEIISRLLNKEKLSEEQIALLKQDSLEYDFEEIKEKDSYHEKLLKIKEKSPRAYMPWSPEEDGALRLLYSDLIKEKPNIFLSKLISELSVEFRRQPGAIRSRLIKLAIIENKSKNAKEIKRDES